MIDRRSGDFLERISMVMLLVSSIGALIVLVDPRATVTIGDVAWTFGGNGFSDQLKGAVVMLILVGGFTAVVNFWLGASKTGQDTTASVARIAEAAPTVAAAVVAAAAPETVKPETMNVEAGTVNVEGSK